jgi:hypothetical protein
MHRFTFIDSSAQDWKEMTKKTDTTLELKDWIAQQTNPKEAARWASAGEKYERKRILDLLTDFDNEKYYNWLKSDNQDWPDYAQTAIGLRLAIALIKGAK